MTWLTYQLALMPAPDVILHIGAGLCSELADYQQIDPDRIILIEPSPETFNALRQKTADCNNVTTVQAAVAAEAGRAKLRRFNFPELDSLREPTGLYQLLPGLQQIGQAEVSTISPAQLIRRLNLAETTENWLTLEAPGEETAILEALNHIDAMKHFSRLIVRTGAEPFYEGDSSAAPLLDLLESFGYFAESAPDNDDPDWPRYHLKFQPLALKCRDLEARVEESQQQLAETTEENRAKAEEADALKSRIAELEKERDELDSTRRELSKQAEASARELDQAKAEWNKERQALEAKKTEEADAFTSQIKDLKKERKHFESSLTEIKSVKEKLAIELRELKKELDEERTLRATAQRDSQNYLNQLTENQQELQHLRSEDFQLQDRQLLMEQEIVRAEAQIDLIKELVLRKEHS